MVILIIAVIVLLSLFAYNIKSLLYTDRAMLLLLVMVLGYVVASMLESGSWTPIVGAIVGSAILGLLLTLIYIKTKGIYFGFGDAKLGFVVGLLVGFPGALFCLIALILTGTLYFLFIRISKLKKLSRLTISSAYFWVIALAISVAINNF